MVGPVSEVARREFIAGVLEALAQDRVENPFHPTWVASWDTFVKHIDDTPESWLEATGIVRSTAPRWIIVLKY